MNRKIICCVAVGMWIPLAAGCNTGVPEKTIEVKVANDPLHQPRSILKRYAEGQPLGSEVTTFPAMVEKVRETDPARADILEKGLEEIQNASPGARPSKAKELLGKLQPSMKAPQQQADEDGQAE